MAVKITGRKKEGPHGRTIGGMSPNMLKLMGITMGASGLRGEKTLTSGRRFFEEHYGIHDLFPRHWNETRFDSRMTHSLASLARQARDPAVTKLMKQLVLRIKDVGRTDWGKWGYRKGKDPRITGRGIPVEVPKIIYGSGLWEPGIDEINTLIDAGTLSRSNKKALKANIEKNIKIVRANYGGFQSKHHVGLKGDFRYREISPKTLAIWEALDLKLTHEPGKGIVDVDFSNIRDMTPEELNKKLKNTVFQNKVEVIIKRNKAQSEDEGPHGMLSKKHKFDRSWYNQLRTEQAEPAAPPESVEIIKELRKLKHVTPSSPLEQKQHKASLYDTLRTLDPKGFKAKRGWHKFHKNWKPFLQKGPQFDEGDFEEFEEQETVPTPKYPGMEGWKEDYKLRGDQPKTRIEEQIDLMEQQHPDQQKVAAVPPSAVPEPIVAETVKSDFVAQDDGRLPGQGPQSQQAQFGADRLESAPIVAEGVEEATVQEFGDVEASEQLIADVNVDPVTGRELPKVELPKDIPTETTESIEEETETLQPGQVPYRPAEAKAPPTLKEVVPGFKPEPPQPPAALRGKVPSETEVVKEDFTYEEKDKYVRDLRDNPEKIKSYKFVDSVNVALDNIPDPIITSMGGKPIYRDDNKDVRDKLQAKKVELLRTGDPEDIMARHARGEALPGEEDIITKTLLEVEDPIQKSKDLVMRAEEMLQHEMDRYKSKEFELSKVDPKRFWANATTGQKIWGAIGVMLGAVGGAMSGQPNYAANMIQKMIDADIDAQKDSNENKKIMKNEAYRRVMMQISNLERAETNKFQREKLGLLRQDMGLKMLKFQKETGNFVKGKAVAGAAHAQGGMSWETWRRIQKDYPKFAKSIGDKIVVIGKQVHVAANKETAINARKVISTVRKSGMSQKVLKDLSGKLGWFKQLFKFADAYGSEQARVHAKGLIGLMKDAIVGPGVMTEQDRKLIEDLMPNPERLFRLSATNRARLDYLVQRAEANIKDALEQAAISIPVGAAIKENKSNIKKQLTHAGLEINRENIKKAIGILKKNKLWKSQTAMGYILGG